MQADPIGLAGGINLFAYVQNDPVNWADPEGLIKGIHFDRGAKGERLIHYNKSPYRFNRAGELVEHNGRVIKEVPKDAKKLLDWLTKVKPDFFRIIPLLFWFPGQDIMLKNFLNGMPIDYNSYDKNGCPTT